MGIILPVIRAWKNLSELKVKIDVPEIPLLNIKRENMIYSDLFTGILLNASTMKTGRRRQITWLITIGIHRQMLQDIVSRILKNS